MKLSGKIILASAGLIGLMALAPSASAKSKPVEKATEIISTLKQQYAPDKRQARFNIEAVEAKKGKKIILKGVTTEKAGKEALDSALAANKIKVEADSVTVYPDDKWGQVRISVACFRYGPDHAAEMATQGIMGTPIRLLEYDKGDGFWLAQTPDGYISYVVDNSIVTKTPEEIEKWKSSPRVIVTNPYQTRIYISPEAKGLREVVSDVINGCILELKSEQPVNGRYNVVIPDGREGWIDTSDVTDINTWANQPFDADVILDQAYSMEGTPYLWGGMSPKTLDCSGLAKVSYFADGIILMRDASQQATTGTRIEAENWRDCKAGDLLFFGNKKTGRVTHVAIYDGDGNYVHSSGRVKRNSVDPESESYLTTPFLHAVRINGNQGTRGIIPAKDHSWYFKQNYATVLPK